MRYVNIDNMLYILTIQIESLINLPPHEKKSSKTPRPLYSFQDRLNIGHEDEFEIACPHRKQI